MKINLFLVALILSTVIAHGQYQRSFGNSDTLYAVNSMCYGLEKSSNDGFMLAGMCKYLVQGKIMGLLMRLDNVGEISISWNGEASVYEPDMHNLACYYSSVREIIYPGSTILGYVAAGGVENQYAKHLDMLLVNVDADGEIVSQNAYGGGGNDYINCIQTVNGGDHLAIVGTYEHLTAAGKTKYLFAALTGIYGNIIPSKTIAIKSNNESEGLWIEETSDGGFIATGYSYNGYEKDLFVVKISKNFSVEWTKTYAIGNGNDVGRCIKELPDADGNEEKYVITGFTEINGKKQAILLSIYPNLNQNPDLIDKVMFIDSQYETDGNNIIVDTDEQGNRYFLVSGRRVKDMNHNAILFKVNEKDNDKLELDWFWEYKTDGGDIAYELKKKDDNYYFTGVCGLIGSENNMNNNVYFTETDRFGCTLSNCEEKLEVTTKIIRTSPSPVYYTVPHLVVSQFVKLKHFKIPFNKDECGTSTNKKSLELSDNRLESDDINDLSFKVYPIPAGNTINIEYGEKYYDGEIQIINISGHKIFSLKLNNTFSESFSIEELPDGLYFIQITGNYGQETLKFQKQ